MKHLPLLAVLLCGVAQAQTNIPQLPRAPAAARQTPLTPPGAPARPAPAAAPAAAVPLVLEAGAGRLLRLPAPAVAVLAADPRIARVQPASPDSIFLMAVGPGRTTVIATGEGGVPVAEYDVVVQPGRAALETVQRQAQRFGGGGGGGGGGGPGAPAVQNMIRRLVPGAEGLTVTPLGSGGLALSGTLPTAEAATRAEAIARAYGGEGREVTNNLNLLSSIQVNLRVRVAEISRQVTRELGFNWQALAHDGANWAIGLRTGTAGGIAGAIAGAISSAATNGQVARYGVRYSSSRFDINGVIDALAADQLITILAEPNLTAQSGEVASFLAGGEFPVPVAASSLTNNITIEFKQFGVSLAFVPTVLGPERLNLRVRPEVSELSDNGAINLPVAGGVVRVPALTVRRAETTIELGSGQSFAIAGLLQRSTTTSNQGLAGLGDIPVLGALFRSDRYRRNETELVIIITPYLVRPVSDPRALGTPNDSMRPATDLDRILLRRQLDRGSPLPQFQSRLDAGFILE
ncbi:type II and III secretion system protein family protein [Sediminicoccus rosea]|uniref:Type II and III secretion system protein family protein n=1 Tax=Sediminicoccus rosea TaxID=1225128 RepID=A0ABZ0PF55_9PROT|nr:type II and III secretion system protein family protein [Sediminicoccus rosea]WPB83916.1 type II and III secretion system protein family protein [Sediminicoccus rosea]